MANTFSFRRISRATILTAATVTFATTAAIAAAMDWGLPKVHTFDDSGETYTYETRLVPGDVFSFSMQFFGGNNFSSAVDALVVTANGQAVCTDQGCDGATWTATAAGDVTLAVATRAKTGQIGTISIACAPASTDGCKASSFVATPVGPTSGGSGTGSGSAQTGNGPTNPQQLQAAFATQRATAAAGSSSASAAGSAIGNAMTARGGSVPRASTQGLFFSTQSQDDVMNLWAGISGTKFSGSLTGQGGEVTMGADWQVGQQTFLGAALSWGKYDITLGGTSFETEALAIGPYLSHDLDHNLSLDAYLMRARPEYRSNGQTWRSERTLGGVDLGIGYDLGTIAATGHFALSGFEERVPGSAPGGGGTVSQVKASIGSTFEFAPAAAIRPRLSIGADAIRLKDGVSTTESLSPSLGLGLDADLGLGTLSFNLDAGEVFDKARATSFGLRYTASF